VKYLVACLESKPLFGPVIKSVFDHSQLFIADSFHAPLLVNVFAQQTIKVLVAGVLSAATRIGKVGLDAKGLIDGQVIRKLFAVVHRQSLHPSAQGLKFGFFGPAHKMS
jgi:hypothetical protein